ncbi:MAG TPA: winged helix-turn-helix domain-containing protein [Caulobacteraceae bacterium]|jgi:DNA-binding transcriptional ArsR family regulator|nr:winged helix-turn-helix domain-containing protein [Caulobacteraceae bacterium]
MVEPIREAAPNIAAAAALIGEPARAAMLWSLIGGQTRPAGELARIAGVSPQAASGHLARLVDGGLASVEPRGRHRFYRLSGAPAASVMEALAVLAGEAPSAERLRAHVPRGLREARRCWGHLAGGLAVRLHDELLDRGWLKPKGDGYEPTASGRAGLAAWGVDVALLAPGRRGLAFPCLDWSERRPHLGGPLAGAILQAAIANGWVEPTARGRALRITAAGTRALSERLGEAAAA